MESKNEAERRIGKPRVQSVVLFLIIAVVVVLAGLTLVAVGTGSQVPSQDFVTLPNTHLSTQGNKVVFVSVSTVFQKSLAVGVKGNLVTASGSTVTGAKVYITYYYRGSYRTQVATTDQNGFFQVSFPMNWTGWLPLTLTYFGDDQHQGLTQVVSLAGEGSD